VYEAEDVEKDILEGHLMLRVSHSALLLMLWLNFHRWRSIFSRALRLPYDPLDIIVGNEAMPQSLESHA
jgi:hypothetical protein